MSELYIGKTPVAPEVLDIENDVIAFQDTSETGQDQLKIVTLGNLRLGIGAARVAPTVSAGGKIWAGLGDSITNGSTATASRRFIDQVPKLCGTAYMPSTSFINAGVPGNTSAQALARYDTDIRAAGAQGVIVLLGTNDSEQGIPVATFAANIQAIAAKARQDGIPMILCQVPPRPSSVATTSTKLLTAQYNLWISSWAPGAGVYVAKVYEKLQNGENALDGYFITNDLHPNTIGHQLIAEAIYEAWLQIPKADIQIVTVANSINDVMNPLASGAGSIPPTNWAEQPGGTGTAPAYSMLPADGILKFGQWARMDFTATVGGTRYLTMGLSPKFGCNVGDKFLVSAKMRITDIAGNYRANAWNANPAADVGLLVLDSGFVIRAQPLIASVASPGYIASTFIVPSGVTSLRLAMYVKLPTGAHIYADVGEVGLFNLTGMGMAGMFH